MKKIRVKAEREYDVLISKNNKEFLDIIKNFVGNSKVMIITDDKVSKLYLEDLKNNLIKENIEVFTYIFKNGEISKNFDTYKDILLNLSKNCFNRNDIIISLGGGVVGDISAFVSSTYMRGIRFIQIPTTLLSMIDSSIGGKTGIDLNNFKNIVGSFYSPFLVLIDTSYLKTLDEEELMCGYGEFIKYAILDKNIYERAIKELKNMDFEELIYLSLKLKADIVEKDLYEKNIRMSLNLGHTIGHALETKYSLKIKHGIAVVEGIRYILNISKKILELSQEEIKKINNLIDGFGFTKIVDDNINDLIKIIKHDKKVKDKNSINLVLINKIGDCKIKLIDIKEIEEDV